MIIPSWRGAYPVSGVLWGMRMKVDGRGISRSESAPVAISAVAWQPSRDLDLGEWAVYGKRLGAISRGAAWWIGDWVNYGNAKFGEKYVRAAHVTGYDVKSLMNMASVAGKFPLSRRRENLSWSHHAEVAGLSPEVGDQWLAVAEARGLSVHGLREELRSWRARSKQELVADRHGESGFDAGSGTAFGVGGSDETADGGVEVDVAVNGAMDDAVADVVDGAGDGRAVAVSVRCPQCGYAVGATPVSAA